MVDGTDNTDLSERDLASLTTRIGTTVDKYTIVKILGKGGMGTVYEARHATLARRFAIKFLLPGVAADADVLRRFENEAKAAGGLEHPNLAAVTDVGRDVHGAPYLVMEFLEGEDCAKLLARQGPQPPARAANIVLQACRGLAVAHKAGIVHRDLKPANLFLTDAGDGNDLVKVLDFGIAKLRSSEASVATGTGETFGTAHYMSPEQAKGAGDVDARTDVWSLGVVLYELLAGRKPFEDGPFLHVVYQILSAEPCALGTLRAGIPGLVAIVERAMAKEPSGRYRSVVELGEALAPFAQAGKSVGSVDRFANVASTMPTPATGVSPRAGSGARRGSAWKGLAIGLGLLAVVAGVAVAVFFVWGGQTRGGGGPGPARSAEPAAAQPAPPVTTVPPSPERVLPAPSRPAAATAVETDDTKLRPSPAKAKPARRLFEHAEDRSNRHGSRFPSPAASATATPTSPVVPEKPAPTLEPAGSEDRIVIDKVSPYPH